MNQADDDMQAYLEVTLPDFGYPVLYCDQHNLHVRKKYDYPSYLVNGYRDFAQTTRSANSDLMEESKNAVPTLIGP